jgi:HlyD family secretion protein
MAKADQERSEKKKIPKKIPKKKLLKWIALGGGVVVVAIIASSIIVKKKRALPEGIASGNGRIEGKLVDVSAKEPLRVKQILVDEGALVKPGEVLVRMDTSTLEAELAAANASVAEAQERMAVSEAGIVKQKSAIGLAGTQVKRSENLVRQHAGSQQDLDVRRNQLDSSRASLSEVNASLKTAEQGVEVAKENAAAIQTRITDATLTSPVTGRVLYRLAEPGEVLAAGGKALTLVNLEDVYMEIFLPSEQAARLKVGAEARITVDFEPNRSVAGYVSFVSPEAQFTPKQVETKNEREKLMFRVKIQIPKEIATHYVERIKTGVRGVGYVKLKDSAVWPAKLQNVVTVPKGPVAE